MSLLTRQRMLCVSSAVRCWSIHRCSCMRFRSTRSLSPAPHDSAPVRHNNLALLPRVLREWKGLNSQDDRSKVSLTSMSRLLGWLVKEVPPDLLPAVLTASVRAGLWRFGAGAFGRFIDALFTRASKATNSEDILAETGRLKEAYLTHQYQLCMSGTSGDLLALCAGVLNLNLSVDELRGLLDKIEQQWKGSVNRMTDEQLEQFVAVLHGISLYDDPYTQEITMKFLPEVQLCLQKRLFRFSLPSTVKLSTRMRAFQAHLSGNFLQRFDRRIADGDLRQLQLADLHSISSMFAARGHKSHSAELLKSLFNILENGYVDDPSAATHIHGILKYVLKYQEEMMTKEEFSTLEQYVKQLCEKEAYVHAAQVLSSLRCGSELTVKQRSAVVGSCGKSFVESIEDCQQHEQAGFSVSLFVTMTTLQLPESEVLTKTVDLAVKGVSDLATSDLVELVHGLSLWKPAAPVNYSLQVATGKCNADELTASQAVSLARSILSLRVRQADWSKALLAYVKSHVQTLLENNEYSERNINLSELACVVLAVVQGAVRCQDELSEVRRYLDNLCRHRGWIHNPASMAKLVWCCISQNVYPRYALEALFKLPLPVIKETVGDRFAATCLRDLHWLGRNGLVYHLHEGLAKPVEECVMAALSHSVDVPAWLCDMLNKAKFQPKFGILTKEGYAVHAAMLRPRNSTKWVRWEDVGLDPSNFTEQQLLNRNLFGYAVRICPETSFTVASVCPLPEERMEIFGLRSAGWTPLNIRLCEKNDQATLVERLNYLHASLVEQTIAKEKKERRQSYQFSESHPPQSVRPEKDYDKEETRGGRMRQRPRKQRPAV